MTTVKARWELAGDILCCLGAVLLGFAIMLNHLSRFTGAEVCALAAGSIAVLGLLCFMEVQQIED